MRHAFGLLLLLAGGTVLAAPPFYPDKDRLLVWKDEAGKSHPIRTPADWAKRRAHILANMQEVMGALPSTSARVPLDVQYGDTVRTAKYTRRKLTFAVAKGERVPAWLLIPTGLVGRAPAVLCLHQTVTIGKDEPAGLGKREELRYAVHLAERGYVTLAPDYPSFGEYKYDFSTSPFVSGSMKAIWNNLCAVDVLASLPEVDAGRIGCIGHSLGGHNAMFTAAFDTRLRAVVSNCGFTSFPKYYGGKLKGWTSARYMPRIATVYQNRPDRVPFDFPEVVAALAPRAFLASAPVKDHNFEVSGVKDCIAAALPVHQLLGAGDKLQANYPDCKHEFPPDVRKVAYDFLDRWLKDPVELTVRETAGIRRFGYPVHVTFALPRDVTDKDRFRLLSDGKPVAAQFRTLAGEKRSVALDFNVSMGPLQVRHYTIEYGPTVEAGPEPKAGMKVEEDKEAFTTSSGGMVYVVPRELRGLLKEVRDRKKEFTRAGSAGLVIVTGKKARHAVGGAGFKGRVVRQGPLAVALRFEGQTSLPGGKSVTSVVDLTLPRSKSWVEVHWQVAGPGAADVTELGVDLNLLANGSPTLVDFGAGSAVYTTLTKGQSALLRGRAARWEVLSGRVEDLAPLVVSTSRSPPAEGWAHLMDRQHCTAVAVASFGRAGTDEIQLDADGRLRLRRQGALSLRFWLHFVDMPVQVGALTSPQSMQAPLVVEIKAAR
jgi:dienelactone hydrolase